MTNTQVPRPHDRLYTRIGAAPGKGIGVFAVRDIPHGVDPFQGDEGETTLVPLAEVERIEDPELRRFYFDFCPLVQDHFLAPVDFNRMTIAWYMNHADEPNIVPDPRIRFTAARPIGKGEELTVDYRSFSDHADRFIRSWNDR